MIYPVLDSSITKEILKHKEFSIFKIGEVHANEDFVNNMIVEENNILLENYQHFVNNFINPITGYNRLLLNFSTGAGKTITALSCAKTYLDTNPDCKIIILGFTKSIFKSEIMKKKMFSFIKPEDINEFKKTRKVPRYALKELNKKYVMYGYQSFFNTLFSYKDGNITELTREVLIEKIANGSIKVNKNLVNKFKKAFIICDEFHHLYNVLQPNNWAVAITFILDYYQDNKALFLSATPIKHINKEIIYIINLLNKREDRIKSSDLFINNNLKPGADEIIKQKTYGKICYVNLTDLSKFPEKIFQGETISEIPNFKFVRCRLNKDLEKEYLNNEALSKNRYSSDYIFQENNKSFSSGEEILENYKRTANKYIYLTKENIITGECLTYDNIAKISPKYHEMLKIIKGANGKILIFHPYVNNSGVLFIEEILKINGYVKYGGIDNNLSICYHCNKRRDEKHLGHEFKPITFINAHGLVSKNAIDEQLKVFNEPENGYGENIKIIIASTVLQEGYTLKAVQHLIIAHSPINISSFTQIIGRAIRKNSHALIADKKVNIYILVLSFTNSKNLSSEELAYKEKVKEYEKIQYINNLLYKNSVDYDINFNINTIDEGFLNISKSIINAKNNKNSLNPMNSKSIISNVSLYKTVFWDQVIIIIKYIIKRLFLEVSNVYNYNDLYKAVKSSNSIFHVSIDTEKINESDFNIAINELVYNLSTNIIFTNSINGDITDLLINRDFLFYNYKKEKVAIRQHCEFFFLTKFENLNEDIDYNNYFKPRSFKNTINLSAIINKDKFIIKNIIKNMLEMVKTTDLNNKFIYKFTYGEQLKVIEYLISTGQNNDILESYKLYRYIIYDAENKPIGHCFTKDIKKIYKNNNWETIFLKDFKKPEKLPDYYLFHEINNNQLTLNVFYTKYANNSVKDKRLHYKGYICKSVKVEEMDELIEYAKLKKFKSRNDACSAVESVFLKKKYHFFNLYEKSVL